MQTAEEIERIEFSDFLDAPGLYQEAVDGYWSLRWAWIKEEMNRLGYSWVVVCGGKIIASSRIMSDFPSDAELREIGIRHNRIPFHYAREIPPEN